MRPWHCDVMGFIGFVCLMAAAFLFNPLAALGLVGFLLLLLAWALAPGTRRSR